MFKDRGFPCTIRLLFAGITPRVRVLAEKALELDYTFADAYSILVAVGLFYDWDWYETKKRLKKAIELNPGLAPAHITYACFLSAMGRHDEALIEIKRAQDLDPLYLIMQANEGLLLFNQHKFDKAIDK